MTLKFLVFLAAIEGSVALRLLLVVLALPAVLGLLVADLVWAIWTWWRLRRLLAIEETTCCNGHAVVVKAPDAAWTCGACTFVSVGTSGFGPCPQCFSVPGWLGCSCGASIPNPVFDLLEER